MKISELKTHRFEWKVNGQTAYSYGYDTLLPIRVVYCPRITSRPNKINKNIIVEPKTAFGASGPKGYAGPTGPEYPTFPTILDRMRRQDASLWQRIKNWLRK